MGIVPNKKNSLFRTNLNTSNKFKSYAETEYEKRKKKEHQKILEEINRRNCENDYNV